jgi:hypothetical protein
VGSRGGYQAVVRRDTFESLAAQSLNDDDAPEVPGLEVVIHSDGRAGRSRHVLQFAAVLAESRYGIFELPRAEAEVLGLTIARPPVPGVSAFIPSVPVPVSAAPNPRPDPALESVLQRVRAGWKLALFDPREGALVGALWLFLGAPLFTLGRRRLLERLGR